MRWTELWRKQVHEQVREKSRKGCHATERLMNEPNAQQADQQEEADYKL